VKLIVMLTAVMMAGILIWTNVSETLLRSSLRDIQRAQILRFGTYFFDYTSAEIYLESLSETITYKTIYGTFNAFGRKYFIARDVNGSMVLEPCPECSCHECRITIGDVPTWKPEREARTI